MSTVFKTKPDEIFRLLCAYVAIRDPRIRREFLTTVEAWAGDQFDIGSAGELPQ